MERVLIRSTIATIILLPFLVLAPSIADATIYAPYLFKITIIAPGDREENGSPGKLAFPGTLDVSVDGYCARNSQLRELSISKKEAILLLDIDPTGTVSKIELLEPIDDMYWAEAITLLIKCNAIERAFSDRGVLGWSNIRASLK